MVAKFLFSTCPLLGLLSLAPAHAQGVRAAPAAGGLKLEVWKNSAMAGKADGAMSAATAPLSGAWPKDEWSGVLTAEWSGSLTPTETANYFFNCSFDGGFGLGWVDGHVLCTQNMPLYRSNVGPGAIPLVAGKAYSLRFQFMKNTTTPPNASACMRWAKAAQLGGNPTTPLQSIPTNVLTPALPTAAEERMAELRREQFAETAGWGSWFPHNLLAVTRLPDGAQLNFGLCQLSTSSCEYVTVDSAQSVRLGPHAADGSFAQLWHWWAGGGDWDGGVNVSVTWGTQPARDDGGLSDLRLMIGEAMCSNCSNYAIVLVPQFCEIWGRTGIATVDGDVDGEDPTLRIGFTPHGELRPTSLDVTGPAGPRPNVNLTVKHLAFAVKKGEPNSVVVSSIAGETAPETVTVLQKAEASERATYAAYGSPVLAELKEAVQASVMWLTVYTPYISGLMLTLSRGSMGGGNSQCDWDNFFAAMMQGSDDLGKNLGFVTFGQTLGSKTLGGFVPNGANAAKKARDRTEPIVGSKVLLSFLKRFGIEETAWLIQWSFDQLHGWHEWAMRARILSPSGLIAPGSSPILPLVDPSDWGVNTMQGARWETGMDNSPMYDGPDGASHNKSGPIIFNTSNHLMELMDVGMTANLAADMGALAELGNAWCDANGTAPHASACSAETHVKIAWLESTAAQLADRMQQHLWNEQVGAFVNKMPAHAYNLSEDTFYTRLSPTSFYPLMGGHATQEQAKRMVTDHLLNPTGFCVTPKESWPPTAPTLPPDVVMLQSYRGKHNPDDVSLCVATNAQDKSSAPGSCAHLQAAGGSLLRNESIVWSSPAVGRIPLYLFQLSDSSNHSLSQTVLGRTLSDFSVETSPRKLSSVPVCYIGDVLPQPGAWPLRLWSSNRLSSTRRDANENEGAAGTALSSQLTYRLSGGPASDQQIESAQDSAGQLWNLSASLGWALPLPDACYWGLPSVSFDDPAFGSPGSFVYWRGNAWAPLAMLVYWGLEDTAYANISVVATARSGLAHSYATMWMETAWRPSRTVCENYCVHKAGRCCGDTFCKFRHCLPVHLI